MLAAAGRFTPPTCKMACTSAMIASNCAAGSGLLLNTELRFCASRSCSGSPRLFSPNAAVSVSTNLVTVGNEGLVVRAADGEVFDELLLLHRRYGGAGFEGGKVGLDLGNVLGLKHGGVGGSGRTRGGRGCWSGGGRCGRGHALPDIVLIHQFLGPLFDLGPLSALPVGGREECKIKN